eukprot:scaffold3713_cov372-Prasinococcus_capsulatus_cf.AAC.23
MHRLYCLAYPFLGLKESQVERGCGSDFLLQRGSYSVAASPCRGWAALLTLVGDPGHQTALSTGPPLSSIS